MSIKGKYNDKTEPFIEAGKQVAFFFDKRISIVDLNAAKESFSIEGKIEETSAFKRIETGDKTYIVFGFNKRLVAFDGDSGQKLWETTEGSVDGSVRWVGSTADPGKVLIATLKVDRFGGDAGTWIKLYGIEMASGAVAWEQMIGYSQLASGFVGKAFSGMTDPRTVYDISIWFEGPYEEGDNRIFLIKGIVTGDPVSLEREESQGFISVNSSTGKVNYLTRFEVLHPKGKEGYVKAGGGVLRDINNTYPDPIDDGESIIAASYTSIAKLNKKSGALMWQIPTPDLVTSMADQGGVLLSKLGMMVTTATHEQGKIKTEGKGYKPYGFMAIDANSGKQLWANTEFKIDPLEAMAAVFEDGILYGCDGDDLYAISMADGKRKWSFNIKNDGAAGKITGDKAWAVKVDKSSYFFLGTTTTTTTWSNPRRILRVDYRSGHFIIYGDKKIIRVDMSGQLTWAHEWKYDPNQKHLLFDPTYVGANDDIVYACKGFYGIDGKTGEIKWADKDVEGEFTQVSDDLLVVRKKDQVRGYSLK